MKKKKSMLLLSFSLAFSMFMSSVTYAAEENEIFLDEAVEENDCNSEMAEPIENNVSDLSLSIEAIQPIETESNFSLHSEEEALAVQELADAGESSWEDITELNLSY